MMKTCKLMLVSANNNNKFYDMKEIGDGTFQVEFGRVGMMPRSKSYPMSKWNSVYREKVGKGYKDNTTLFIENTEVESQWDIDNISVKELVQKLITLAKTNVSQNYNVSSKSVTKTQLDQAQTLLDRLSNEYQNLGISSINDLLIELYHIIPRKMKHIKDHIFETKDIELVRKKIFNEQSTLDVLSGQVLTGVHNGEKINLQDRDLFIDVADQFEIKMIKDMMEDSSGQFTRAFKVINLNKNNKFTDYVEQSSNKTTKLLWHGSRNENWWNIINTGLLIRPSNAVLTGSMFGEGIYFANKARKSIGYTSVNGSYWARGNEKLAYLSLFNVHTGLSYIVDRHDYSMSSMNKTKLLKLGNYNSLFAKKGADLRNDEIIVYDANQASINYIVEIRS
jgi:poly [ADP-ribose] polymerase 2/3/4